MITAKFQDGDPVYRKAWQHIRKVSVEAVKENYRELGVHFDLWLGESDAHETCFAIKKIAEEKGLLEYDDGAYIIRLDEENKPKPPVIIEKSDGGFTYQATDIATIKMRVDDLHADEIIYFVDKRQSLHFEQVFEVVEKLGIAPGVKLQHIGFGTVNGADGKPFKTRDGGVMNLADMIKMSKDKVAESMPAPDEAKGITREYIDRLVSQIAVGAIKFQDLKITSPPVMFLNWTTSPTLTAKPVPIFNTRWPESIRSCAKIRIWCRARLSSPTPKNALSG